jgi:hypothetical protein
MIGLALAVANYEVDMYSNFSPLNPDLYPNAMDDPRNMKASTNMIRLIIMITTLLAIGCLVTRHYYKVVWLNKYFMQDSETHIYFQYQEVMQKNQNDLAIKQKKLLSRSLVLEILILMVCPIPYIDWYV